MRPLFGGLFVLAVMLLSGCGGGGPQAEFDRAEMDALFATVDLRIAQDVLKNGADLPAATTAYIGLIRKYDGDLGDKEIRRMLTDKANQVDLYCGACASQLDRERENY
jgi:hypothetical protein